MSKKILLPLALIVAVAVFAGCGATTGVMKHESVPADMTAPKTLPAALAENNWRTTTSNGLSENEVAVGDYGNFKMFAVKFSTPEEAYRLLDRVVTASEDCNNCSRDNVAVNNRGYLKYRGPDIGFTLGGEAITQPFMVWNNGVWVFAVENTGSEDWRDQVAEVFPY